MTTEDVIKKTLMELLVNYSADDITVKMLCMEAGISKQTLYNHYHCIMDVLEDSYRDSFREANEDGDTHTDILKDFCNLLEILADNRKATMHVYNSSHRDELMGMIHRRGERLISRSLALCGERKGYIEDDRDREFTFRFYMYIFMGIVESYLEDNMKDAPEEIATRSSRMLRYHIRRSLKSIVTTGDDRGENIDGFKS